MDKGQMVSQSGPPKRSSKADYGFERRQFGRKPSYLRNIEPSNTVFCFGKIRERRWSMASAHGHRLQREWQQDARVHDEKKEGISYVSTSRLCSLSKVSLVRRIVRWVIALIESMFADTCPCMIDVNTKWCRRGECQWKLDEGLYGRG